MNLAPIVIFTFNRLEHTKKTIEALKKNDLAIDSEIYIFSDGPRNNEEVISVEKVRNYIKTIDGFKKINIIESKINKGLAKSVIEGVTDIIQKYGKVIVIEDDLVTSKHFLKYMNEALDIYQERPDIWSISGYTPNIKIPKNYTDEVYLIKRGASWGWATWKDRWKLNDWEIKDYNEFKKNIKLRKSFNEAGSDMSPMLNDQMKGRINSWAIRWGYNQFKMNMWTIYPIRSLVKNIGNDLSGTHTSITNKYNVILATEKPNLNKSVQINPLLCKEFKKFYDLNLIGYLGIFIKKVGLYRQARKIRNKILLMIKR